MVRVRHVRMVSGFLVVPSVVKLGCLMVMPGRLLVVLSGLTVMIGPGMRYHM
jgi:hypothetical protein